MEAARELDRPAAGDDRRHLRHAPSRPCARRASPSGSGYHAGLLSLAAFKGAGADESSTIAAAIAEEIPLVGFYLQPAVGGIHLDAEFWRRFCAIDNVVAIKVAPFNRYRTLDVVRGLVAAAAEERDHALHRQ